MPAFFAKLSPMLIIFGLIAILPFKIRPHQLKALAFTLWLVGGVFLCYRGLERLMNVDDISRVGFNTVVIAGLIGLAVGLAKGMFVLSKTSNKNIERLDALTEPLPPRNVYSKRSWIVIALMIGIAMTINFGLIPMPIYIRGAVNLAIGFALIISSLNYLGLKKKKAAA